MQNLLRSASRWLSDLRERHVAEDVVYSTSAGNVSLIATPIRRGTMMGGRSPVNVQADGQAFIFKRSDLTSNAITPKSGHKILWSGQTFEVVINRKGMDHMNDGFSQDTVIETRKIQ